MTYSIEEYQRNKEAYAERQRRYKEKHKKKIAERQAFYRNKTKGKLKEYREKKYAKHRAIIDDIKKKSKCEKCGFEDYRALIFHHRHPEEKEFGITSVLGKFSIKRILKEIEKCSILCANCHSILHSNGEAN